jgi:hypothetical protein
MEADRVAKKILEDFSSGKQIDPQLVSAALTYQANVELARAAGPDICICGQSIQKAEYIARCEECGTCVNTGHHRGTFTCCRIEHVPIHDPKRPEEVLMRRRITCANCF